ncbi:MAG: plasmid mobilization relaxosome protein MobC [Clostridia bacterium]|nr:plasmid mobilization relaxosome protein MobC [Clostridia bacterium]
MLRCPVTEEERAMIMKKMELAHTTQIGAYLRKMAIDGLIIYTDLSVVKDYQKELSSIGRNINQIAKRVNSTGSIYKEDIKDLRERLDDIWRLQRTILLTLR